MAPYNLFRTAGKTATVAKKGAIEALGVSRAAYAKAAAGVKALPQGAKVTMSKLGRNAALPAGLGIGVGAGSIAAGEGVRRGFGINFDPNDPIGAKKASQTMTGVIIFAAVVLVLLFVYMKVYK